MLIIEEYSKRIEELKQRVKQAFDEAGKDFVVDVGENEIVNLVFAGQYSAGKSTIIKMLTGRDDIQTGAGITTNEVNKYDWNGIMVVDTPGILTGLRADHDEISKQAIASADMLVFVITGELFDSHIAEHFRKLAIDNEKAHEMVLVINKMSRTAKGNTPEQQEIICEDIKKVIEPYTPEQLYLSFLDAENYLDGLSEMESDREYAEELIECSGYKKFTETLNRFVAEKKLLSKSTTVLYQISNMLEEAIKELQPKSDDSDIDALEESLNQQRSLFVEARKSLIDEIMGVFISAASEIRTIGSDAANLLVEGCKQDEVETALEQYVEQTNKISDQCQDTAKATVEERLNEIDQNLEKMESSEFFMSLKSRLNGKFEGLPENVRKILTNISSGFQNAGQTVLQNAYKSGTQGGLKLTNFSGSTIHDMVLNVGHAFGVKFEPWQAIKITQKIAIGAQILSFLGVGLSVFMQIKEDRDEERVRIDLVNNRRAIRSQFNSAASELENYGRRYINDTVDQPMTDSIESIEKNIQSIRDSREKRSELCRKMEVLQGECRLLIKKIHSEYSESVSSQ